MSEARWLEMAEGWSQFLLKLYPSHFREEMGDAFIETYRDRSRAALRKGGKLRLIGICLIALKDSLWNGLGERLRPSVNWRRLGNWGRDGGLVLRRVSRAPVFVATMVGTLTVGLGAFAAVYSIVDKVLIEPLPYEAPDDLYFVWRDYGPIFDLNRGWLGGTDVAAMDSASSIIQNVAGMSQESATLGGADSGQPEEVAILMSSPNLFDLLGVSPVLGRGFAPNEVGPGRPPVVVLSHGIWEQRFGGDPNIVGSEIRLGGEPFTVIGVMAEDFRFVMNSSLGPPQRADLYTTFDLDLAQTNPGEGSYAGLVRARAGASPEEVTAAVASVGRMVDERDFEGQGLRLYPVGMKADLISKVRPALVVLGVAGLLLVIVLMVNLATLLLARVAQREREFAISRAMGANGMRLVRAILLEGGVLGLLGGMGGALVAVWLTRALVALAPADLPRREAIGVDWGVAAVVIALGALLGLLAGAVPATWATRARLSTLLRASAVRGGGGQARMRRSMVVVQVALAVVLLSAGGLVVRSFEQLLRADPGFESADVLTLRVPVPLNRYPEADDLNSLHNQIERELSALPGVELVGATSALPLTANASQTTIGFPTAPGNTGDLEQDRPLVDHFGIRGEYLEALGISIISGRSLRESTPGEMVEALIGPDLVSRFFPSGNPIGATLDIGGDSLRVVGVVDHARQYDVHRDDRPQVYYLNQEYPSGTLSWALRTGRSPLSLASEARTAIWRVDPQLAVTDVQTMKQIVAESLTQQRATTVLISGFSLGALCLAAMGLFGVVSGLVTRRRHELAVRMALGAERGKVLRLVLREGMQLVMIGLLLGVPGVYFTARVIGGVLVGVSPFDPLTLASVAVGLGIVALIACYLPARRVLSIEPAGLLRQE